MEACCIQEDEYNDDGDPYPNTLILAARRTVASSVPEALETMSAFSRALDLSKFITLSSYKLQEDDEKSNLRVVISSAACTIPQAEDVYAGETWESVADNGPSLSLRVQGAIDRAAQVPGSCEYGQMGLWFKYRHDRERTQVILEPSLRVF